MHKTMELKIVECLKDSKTERKTWIKKWPGQVILAINSCLWTSNVEAAILDGSLEEYQL